MSDIQLINLDKLPISSGTQVREKLCNTTITLYAERMTAGDKFPPVVVYQNGNGNYSIGDGFHRVKAAALAERKQIEAIVHHGDHRDALDFALRANLTHGNRLTNADKRKGVLMALDVWPKDTNRDIARRCAVSPGLVDKIVKERLPTVGTQSQTVAVQCSVVTPSSSYADSESSKPASRDIVLPSGKTKIVRQRRASPLKGKPRKPRSKLVLAEPEQKLLSEAQAKVNAMPAKVRLALLKWMKAVLK